MEEKRSNRRQSTSRRQVMTGRRTNRKQIKGKKEGRKGEGKIMGNGVEVIDVKDDLNEANTKLFIG